MLVVIAAAVEVDVIEASFRLAFVNPAAAAAAAVSACDAVPDAAVPFAAVSAGADVLSGLDASLPLPALALTTFFHRFCWKLAR